MKPLVLVVAFLAACGGSTPPKLHPAAPAAEAKPASPEATAMLARLDEALAAKPDDQVLMLMRAAYSEAAGKPDDALRFIEKLDASRWDVPFTSVDFKTLANDPRYQRLNARITARAPKAKRSELAFTIPGPDLIPEGIAVDTKTGTFYVGSIHKRTIIAVDRDRKARTFVPAGQDSMSGVLGMKVDAARGVLWATSWASEGMHGFTEADKGRSEVTAFALGDGAKKRRIAFPPGGDPHLLNDIAIASDGTLYITDSVTGAVWRVPTDRDEFQPVAPPRSFAYPNGIVWTANGRLLVAHGTGIANIDPATGDITRLPNAPGKPLGGIDGLVLDGRTLYAVQNGLGAPRLVAIELDDKATTATKLTVLESDPSVLEIPTTSTLFEGALYTIANSQLDALGPTGLVAGKQLHDPRIVRTPLR
jgi:sugar lactone lactonase YvrE